MNKRIEKRRRSKIIGQCTFTHYNRELTWGEINREDCLNKKCDYFSWISLSDRDKWVAEHGEYKRDPRNRCMTKKERSEKRRKENLKYLEVHNISWEWVDEMCDHILINEHIDYYLGSTAYCDRSIDDRGYAMLQKLFKDGFA